MGGIATINDVLEFIMAGATDIAIGIANFNNHFVMPEIISELSKYMKENNVETLDEIRVLLVKNQEEIIMQLHRNNMASTIRGILIVSSSNSRLHTPFM